MKYLMIAGEASGDIHGAQLIEALKSRDADAEFQFLGGDLMARAAGRAPIVHYRDMAYMGFVEVAKHLSAILGFMRLARRAMLQARPDALVLIDYPSFNLKMAKFAHGHGIPVFYFISPKVWAWKAYRVRQIKKYVTRLYSILPFEVEFYRRHGYEVEYVGNPTVKEVSEARERFRSRADFAQANGLLPDKPLIALVPGSRRKEVLDNLPAMAQAAMRQAGCQAVIAAAPTVDDRLYRQALGSMRVPVVRGQSFELVYHARCAVVTSGTATLEAAVLGTPQVACYRMNGKKCLYTFYSRLLHGKYVTLPNLIADSPVIPELLLHFCTPDAIDEYLRRLLPDSPARRKMLEGYERVVRRLGERNCTQNAAISIVTALKNRI